jgi:glycosyltransferase involved in cell wall biosynthesis
VKPHIDSARVEYVGSVGVKKRDELLGGARALLHPINFNEPFGLSVVEAMACGTPTVAFCRGSMPELITDGIDGFLVSTVDQAVTALSHIDALDRRMCRETARQRFDVDRMAGEYADLYERILQASKPGS